MPAFTASAMLIRNVIMSKKYLDKEIQAFL